MILFFKMQAKMFFFKKKSKFTLSFFGTNEWGAAKVGCARWDKSQKVSECAIRTRYYNNKKKAGEVLDRPLVEVVGPGMMIWVFILLLLRNPPQCFYFENDSPFPNGWT